MTTKIRVRCLAGLALSFLFCVSLPAQLGSPAEVEVDLERRRAPVVQPDEATSLERVLPILRDRPFFKIFAPRPGLRLKPGGPIVGSGVALGLEYLRPDLADGIVLFRAAARGSLKQYQSHELELRLPRVGSVGFVNLRGTYRNFPEIGYFGPGPDSRSGARTKFRLEDAVYGFDAGVAPSHWKIGIAGDYLRVNVGAGTDARVPSTEQVFTASSTPGLDRQSDFLRGSVFLQYDYRDRPGGPRRGGNYIAQYGYSWDRALDLHSFRQLHLEVQQYVPFFNERRVFAVRGRSILTDVNRGQTIPFYLQPTLGGPDDLRGFPAFRFYGDNLVVLNAEYRWEVTSGLDMALFGDAGKVFQRRSEWNLRNLEGSYGLGFRFNLNNNVFARVDLAFGEEGPRVWLRFSNVF